MSLRLAVLPGDGIGPEICQATVAVLNVVSRAFSLGIETELQDIGLNRLAEDGTTFPEVVFEAARSADGVLLGPISHLGYPPPSEGGVNVSAELRIRLDLFANIRPARTREGLPHYGRTAMDLVIVRENTEGFYSDRNMFWGVGEFMPTPDVALSIRKITAASSKRIAETAFALARRRRHRVTAVHKANVVRISEGLFLGEMRKVAQQHPDVEYDEQLVDSMAAMLVRDAQRFDVVVTTNMFGDILSDEASELSGSLGLAPAINAGHGHCVGQAQHGSAPDLAGKDVANPTSMILSAAMLLEWLGTRSNSAALIQAAGLIEASVDRLLADPARRTRDVGGVLGTQQFATALCNDLTESLPA